MGLHLRGVWTGDSIGGTLSLNGTGCVGEGSQVRGEDRIEVDQH